MRGVVEATYDPPGLCDDEMGDRGVVRAYEGPRLRTRSRGQNLSDCAAVGDDEDTLARVAGGDALDRWEHPVPERRARLGPGNHIPALLSGHSRRERVTVHDLLLEDPSLPFAQVHLAQFRFYGRIDSKDAGERSGSLGGSPEGRHVDGVDAFRGKTIGKPVGLLATERRKRGVGVTIDVCEFFTLDRRLRLAMPYEKQFTRVFRCRESVLRKTSYVSRTRLSSYPPRHIRFVDCSQRLLVHP